MTAAAQAEVFLRVARAAVIRFAISLLTLGRAVFETAFPSVEVGSEKVDDRSHLIGGHLNMSTGMGPKAFFVRPEAIK